MACSCGSKGSGATGASSTPKSYTVKASDGTTKSYRTEVEAVAAAKRVGGTVKAGS